MFIIYFFKTLINSPFLSFPFPFPNNWGLESLAGPGMEGIHIEMEGSSSVQSGVLEPYQGKKDAHAYKRR